MMEGNLIQATKQMILDFVWCIQNAIQTYISCDLLQVVLYTVNIRPMLTGGTCIFVRS